MSGKVQNSKSDVQNSRPGRGVWPLYAAAFAMAIGLNVLWTATPFIVRNIGGNEGHVGYAWAANMLGYMLCLLFAAASLSWGLLTESHLNARLATRTATAAMFLATSVMIVVVWYAIAHNRLGSPLLIWTMIGAGTLAGAAMSLFWPFLMAWVSADYEGPTLNRRLGTYNGMWSGAIIMGPLIGGALVEMSTLWPIASSAVCLAFCFGLLSLAHDESAGAAVDSAQPSAVRRGNPMWLPRACSEPVEGAGTRARPYNPATLLCFKWMARIALFCSWACIGVSRSQFALLFTGMGFSETQFGILITIFGIFNFLMLTGAGRVGFWHFKPVLLFAVQVILVLALLMIIFGRTLWVFIPAFVIMALGFGFAYSSHLYYGACGSKKRSAPMAIHEVTLSLGVIVGSGAGGYLCKNVGTYAPYWFAAGVLALGLVAQVIVWVMLKPARSRQR